MLLAVCGGTAGVLFAWWSLKALVAAFGIDSVIQVKPDLTVLGFTLVISILTGIGFGLFPAWRSSSIQLRVDARTPALKPARALVVLQVALCCLLLVGAGLLTRSLRALENQDLGFRADDVLLLHTDARLAGYQPAQLYPLYRQFHDRLNGLPGVLSASIARFTPLSGHSSSGNFSIEGYTPPAGKEMNVYSVEVGPGFFETLGIPLLLGRSISPRDTPTSPPVAVVSQSFIQEYLPGQNPIGRRVQHGAPFREPGVEIVGVVGDSKYYDVRQRPKPMAYFSAWQTSGRSAYVSEIVVRMTHDAPGVANEVRRTVQSIDDKLPISGVTTLSRQVYNSVKQERLFARFCSFFGLLALLLASVGIYGTMAYSVSRRTREIGIRMALGAHDHAVMWMVLRESMVLLLLGLACGLPLSIAGTRWIRSYLFGIQPVDPLGIGVALILLITASTLAGYLPARRASKTDPLAALRSE
jgi:predicted permease